MKNKNIKLSSSLRKYIREEKAKIRRQYGLNSPQIEEFLMWVNKEREKKLNRFN